MNILFLVTSLLFFYAANAQKMEKWFDYRWRNCTLERASFYAIITKTDSGWHRLSYFAHGPSLQMSGTYEDSNCKIANGMFYYFYANKKVKSFGRNWHGKRQGLWLGYHQNGTMSDSTSYQNGNPVGISMRWYSNGYIRDSVNWQNGGTGIGYYWYEDGKPSAAGRFKKWQKIGVWQYLHPNGNVCALEVDDSIFHAASGDSTIKAGIISYVDSVGTPATIQANEPITVTSKTTNLISRRYFDETGAPVDTAGGDHPSMFPGGAEAWKKYLYNHLYFPRGYRITNADTAVCVVAFTVGIDGRVKDAFVSIPFSPEFD